jgi:hypothetical protein
MTQTDDARGLDWEGFGRDLLESWPVRDVDGSELFDAALRNGLIAEIPGGYDPDQHIDAEGICPEAGDPWYEYAFHPARADLATQPDPLADPRVSDLREAGRAVIDEWELRGEDMSEVLDDLRAALAAFDTTDTGETT